MRAPSAWGVAGSPVGHSITPMLFDVVGRAIGVQQPSRLVLDVNSVEDLMNHITATEGDVWLSCTSPLKHELAKRFGNSGAPAGSINQIARIDGCIRVGNTDGPGFVEACNYEGIEPKGKILKMRGGGAAARSIAFEWTRLGGHIIPVRGRRELPDGPWSNMPNQGVEADIAIDLDAPPGKRGDTVLDAKRVISISYGSDWSTDDFAIKMVCAQHLVAWKMIYAPEMPDKLPNLEEIISALSAENQMDNHS